MKMKTIVVILIVIFMVMQFIPSGRPDVIQDNKDDLLLNSNVPDSVAYMLKTSCYDCHSNENVYPWYSYISPVSFLVARDVKLGKEELNFSLWESNNKMKKAKFFDDIIEVISDESMPISIYTIMHSDAKLNKANRKMIMDWADKSAEALFE